jgi:hypothetical protein
MNKNINKITFNKILENSNWVIIGGKGKRKEGYLP